MQLMMYVVNTVFVVIFNFQDVRIKNIVLWKFHWTVKRHLYVRVVC